MYKYIIRRYS